MLKVSLLLDLGPGYEDVASLLRVLSFQG